MKLLLKFLKRFQLYVHPAEDTSDFRQANLPSSQRSSLMYARKKVLSAVSLLIINSNEVAVFVNSLVGAESIIRKSAEHTAEDRSSERVTLQLLYDYCVLL